MKRLIILAATLIAGLSACDSLLDKEPLDRVTQFDYFKTKSDLELFSNPFYDNLLDKTPYDEQNDLLVQMTLSDILYGGDKRTVPNTGGGWSWGNLRRINTLLEYVDQCEDKDAVLEYTALSRFFRAAFYFDKVKRFGDVPWYDTQLGSADPDLYKARDSRELVMTKMIEDVDFAINSGGLTEEVTPYRVNKWAALALKARFCLFEGTYRKYHRVDPSTGKAWDPEYNKDNKWLREAADACEELMEAGIYSLVNSPANVATQYRSLFTSPSVLDQEVMWAREYNDEKNVRHDVTWYFTSGSMGQGWSLDADFVYTYLNRDGSRFTDRADYKSTTYAEQFENRDYRLQQTVISPEYRKLVGGTSKLFAPDLSVSYTGYQVIKFNIDDDSYEASGICWNCLPILRYAEVLLNYAEAKAELGEFDDAVWNKTIKPLRERAGVDGTRPTQIDEYLQNAYYSTDDGNPKITDCDILEIRRERAIELLLEGRRYDDLMRWHLGGLLNKQWYGIYIGEVDKAYDLNNDGVNDVCVTDKAGSEPGVKYIVRNSERTLEEGNSGRLVYNLQRYFDEQRYVHPIPKTALDKNPDLGQNAAWK